MAERGGKAGSVVMLLTLAALTSGAAFFWGRQVIAMPACAAFAEARGMALIDYRPVNRIGRQVGSRINNINGSCVMLNHDGVQQSHDLTPELRGWKKGAVVSLRYDLIFFVALVGWGLAIAMWPGDKKKRGGGRRPD